MLVSMVMLSVKNQLLVDSHTRNVSISQRGATSIRDTSLRALLQATRYELWPFNRFNDLAPYA